MASCCGRRRSSLTAVYNPSWMSKLPEYLHCKPLNTIAIPGSHDSFSAGLDPKGGVAPNCPGLARDLSKVFGSLANNIIYKWSVTQDASFSSQLMAGVRYFDLRIAVNPKHEDDLYFCHGLYAHRVRDGLKEIADFLEAHREEVILLDMNHFYGLDNKEHKKLVSLLLEIFGRKLCPAQDIKKVTLQNLWSAEQQVLVFYHDDPTVKDHTMLWPGSAIPSPWAKQCSLNKLLHFLDENFHKGRSKTAFYVTQGVLTPDAGYVIKHLFGSLHDLSCTVIEPFCHWLNQKYSGPSGINVCIMDLAISSPEYITSVIELNNHYKDL